MGRFDRRNPVGFLVVFLICGMVVDGQNPSWQTQGFPNAGSVAYQNQLQGSQYPNSQTGNQQGNQQYGGSSQNVPYGGSPQNSQYGGGSNPSSNQQQQQQSLYGQQQQQGIGQQQQQQQPVGSTPFRFCTVSYEEQRQCQEMATQLSTTSGMRSGEPSRGKRQASTNTKITFWYSCVQAVDKLECMKFIQMRVADVVLVTPGEAYVGWKDFNMAPLVSEILGTDELEAEDQAMAVVRTASGINDITQLRGKRACFGAVGDTISWDLVASYLAKQANQIQTPQCHENYMDSMMKYFGDMCAPYDTRNYTQEENDRYRKLCALCGGQNCPALSSLNKDYALTCLTQNPNADVAFVAATVLRENLRSYFPDSSLYQVLCPKTGVPIPVQNLRPQGGNPNSYNSQSEMRSLDEIFAGCHVGRIPSNVWVTRANEPLIIEYEFRMQKMFNQFSYSAQQQGQGGRPQWFTSFFVGQYDLPDQQPIGFTQNRYVPNMEVYLGNYVSHLEDPVVCPQAARAKWCTLSQVEVEKCEMMRKAFKAHRIRPDLECQSPVKNAYICLDKIHRNQTDLAMIDIGDLVAAGSYYDAVQIAQERFASQTSTGYSSTIMDEVYSVAVVRDSAIRSLSDLRNKRACFSGLYEAHGFMMPISALKNASLVTGGDCHYLRSAIEFFGDSCLPGLADAEINLNNEDRSKMCRTCENGERGCGRGGDSRFAGSLGALNCLLENKGDVAFVSHTVLSQIPLQQKGMLQLLCGTNTGTTQSLDSYMNCNFGKAPGRVLVTNRYKSGSDKRRLADMILTASNLFSADVSSGHNQGYQRLALTPNSLARGQKTYNMFGKRNHTEVGGSLYPGSNVNPYPNPYATTSSYYQPGYGQQTGYGQNPTQQGMLSGIPNTGVYSLFSIGAYELRGFGDLNQTHVGEALGSYRYLAERTNWRRCYETGAAGKRTSFGLFTIFSVILIALVL